MKRGRPTLLDAAVERVLAEKVNRRAAEAKKKCGGAWATRFKKRHGISLVMGEKYGGHRTGALDDEARDSFVRRLKAVNIENTPPRRIWNMDETGVVGFNMVFAANADGSILMPPCLVAAGTRTRLPAAKHAADLSLAYFNSEKGKMTKETFRQWAKDVFVKHMGPHSDVERRVLILDNASPHYDDDTLACLERNHVDVVFLPPHTSDVLQPLDVFQPGQAALPG